MTEKQVGGLLADLDSIAEDDIYWINFLGYESDGNFFKTINQITDISKTYFETVIKVLNKIDSEMSDTEGVEWHKVMAFGRDQTPLSFNFNTLFSLIPVRKEKRNEALTLFKSILEQHSILREKIFSHFVELIQCHRYERYSGYNIMPNSNFDFACRAFGNDGVGGAEVDAEVDGIGHGSGVLDVLWCLVTLVLVALFSFYNHHALLDDEAAPTLPQADNGLDDVGDEEVVGGGAGNGRLAIGAGFVVRLADGVFDFESHFGESGPDAVNIACHAVGHAELGDLFLEVEDLVGDREELCGQAILELHRWGFWDAKIGNVGGMRLGKISPRTGFGG